MVRSPVRVETRKLALGIKGRRWVCDDRLQAAQFQHRVDPSRTVIVHPSTKKQGGWQISYFDDRGASGDAQAPSCDVALRDLHPRTWRLKAVTPKR
jgi:hypothetical protein